jgi:hypothetical protein
VVSATVINAAGQTIGSGTARAVIETGRTTVLQIPVKIDTRGNDIIRFVITSPVSAEGVIVPSSTTIAVSVPFGTNLTGMNFTATHTGASINPAPGTPLDFNFPQTFTVRAENGQAKIYTVRVNLSEPSIPCGGTAVWPSVATWQNYGLSSGLTQPPGATVYTAGISLGTLIVHLQNADIRAFNNLVSQIETQLGSTGTTSSEYGYSIMDTSYDEITVAAVKY